MHRTRLATTLVAGLTALLLLGGLLASTPRTADAQQGPLYQTEPDSTWVVDGPAPTLGRNASNNDVGWVDALQRVGNTIIVGGDFQGVQPSPSGPATSAPFLTALDEASGDHVVSFQPSSAVNAVVRSLALSPDGARLYVGGDFGLAALDPATGALDTTFSVTVVDGAMPGKVWDIETRGTDIYLGGDFTSVNGTSIDNLAKLSDQGVLDTAWDANTIGGRSNDIFAPVQAIDLSPDGATLYVGGTYPKINGVDVPTVDAGGQLSRVPFTALDAATSATQPEVFVPDVGSIQKAINVRDIAATANEVVIAWGGPNRLSFHALDGTRVHQYAGQGDFQALDTFGDLLAVGHHGEFMGGTGNPIPSDGASGNSYKLHTITLDGSYPVEQSFRINGALGIWAIEASTTGLWAGGHINKAGATKVPVEGLVRFDGFEVATQVTIESPTGDGDVLVPDTTDAVLLSGDASHPAGVTDVRVRVRDRDSGLYLQAAGSFGSFIRLPALLGNPGGQQSGWSLAAPLPSTPEGHAGYTVRVQLIESGNVIGDESTNFLVQGVTIESPVANNDVLSLDPQGEVALAGNATQDGAVTDVRVWVRDRDSGLYLQADGSFGGFVRLPAVRGNAGGSQSTWTLVAPLPATPAGHSGYAMEAQLFVGGQLTEKQWRSFDVS